MRSMWLTLALLACSNGPAGEAPNDTWAFAVAQPDCAPWDGAATSVILTDTPPDTAASKPWLWLSAYRSPEGVRGRRFEIGEPGDEGAGISFCPAEGPCEPAMSGWVEFAESAPGRPLEGRYHVTFQDGSGRTGRFSAPLRDRQLLCG